MFLFTSQIYLTDFNPGVNWPFKDGKQIKIKVLEKGFERFLNVSVKPSDDNKSLKIIHSPITPLKKPVTEPEVPLIPPNGPYRCKICVEPTNFNSYYNARLHYVSVHNRKFDARICEYCGFKGYQRSLLQHHMYVKHGKDPPPSITFPKCETCPFIAPNNATLQRHVREHHEHRIEMVKNTTILPPMSSFSPSFLNEPVQVLNVAVPIDYKIPAISNNDQVYVLANPEAAAAPEEQYVVATPLDQNLISSAIMYNGELDNNMVIY